jgi:DeoR/GlpR family transcriptional regulator of sugar metabolism
VSEQRRQDVLRLVREAGRVGLADLAAAAGVSEMTVRRDLDDLTRRGLLRRVRGGAVSVEPGSSPASPTTGGPAPRPLAPARPAPAFPPPATATRSPTPSPVATARPGPLDRVGRAVAELVPDGGTVLLDAGPGAVEVAASLAHRAGSAPLTVAVTSLEAALVLTGSPGVRLVVLGGEPRPGEPGLLGPAALAALADLHLDLFVLTPAGLDPGSGCWVRSPDAAALVRTALARTDSAVAVTAAPCLGRRSRVHAAPLSVLAHLVTPADDPGAFAALEACRDAGLDVVLA